MSAAEFAFWIAFRARHGYPDDRIEAGVAIAGAASCASHGAKVRAADLLPKFAGDGSGKTTDRLKVWLSGVRGVKIRRIPKQGEPFEVTGPERKPRRETRRRTNGR